MTLPIVRGEGVELLGTTMYQITSNVTHDKASGVHDLMTSKYTSVGPHSRK